jgi:uncharacterized protein (DUF952 family)
MKSISHIATQSDWQDALASGAYAMSMPNTPFEEEGFIHCSDTAQVLAIANTYYKDERDLVLLCIDTAKLKAPIIYENTSGGTELFPHVYGHLNTDAVYATLPLEQDTSGVFVFPELKETYHG